MPEGELKENISKYGYRNVGDQFEAHLTLTNFDKEDLDKEKVNKVLKSENLSFKANTLGVCEVGESGTCKKVLKKFKLIDSH